MLVSPGKPKIVSMPRCTSASTRSSAPLLISLPTSLLASLRRAIDASGHDGSNALPRNRTLVPEIIGHRLSEVGLKCLVTQVLGREPVESIYPWRLLDISAIVGRVVRRDESSDTRYRISARYQPGTNPFHNRHQADLWIVQVP